MVGHIQNDECIGEGPFTLHGQSLNSSSGVARQNETFLLLLDCLHFSLDHLGNDLVPHHCEVFEVGLYFLTQLLFLRYFLPQQITNRYGSKFVVICDLECELPNLESWRANNKDFLRCMEEMIL